METFIKALLIFMILVMVLWFLAALDMAAGTDCGTIGSKVVRKYIQPGRVTALGRAFIFHSTKYRLEVKAVTESDTCSCTESDYHHIQIGDEINTITRYSFTGLLRSTRVE